MKSKKKVLYVLVIIIAGVTNFVAQTQQKNVAQSTVENKDDTCPAPNSIVRTIKQDKKGNIWITSWEGVFKYNGKSFTNVTRKVSSARFFSVLEDRKGNLWFASVGSGVYYYDGKSFQNFTTKDGLANDRVTHIYEDKTGIVWFGTEGGVSRYDGKSFRNLKMSEALPAIQTDSVYIGPEPVHTQADSVPVSSYKNLIPKGDCIHNDVNAIIEDKTGKFWLGTRGYAFVYDGKTFTTLINKDKPFTNVRSIIRDKKGYIWLGGADGLWRYDGSTFINFTQNFVGYIYEDSKGNIWTSSEENDSRGWVLSRYDEKSLTDKKPMATKIANNPMIFGILEDDKTNIWFGTLDGVYCYDGKTITDFKRKEEQK